MYKILNEILKDKSGGAVFSPFNIWHILYLLLLIIGICLIVYFFKNKSTETKHKILNITINSALILYILDFFIMPFSRGNIDIDKLPFHICTLMSVMCFLARNFKFFAKFKTSFTLMGLVGALMYIAYPSGVADGEVCIFSYRIIQTLLYHGLMVSYGVYCLTFGDVKLNIKECYKDAIMIALMSVWAVIGNYLYVGIENGRTFNWFFVVNDPFGLFNENIAPYIMPFLMVCVIFIMVLLIYGIYYASCKLINKGK